jgi:hypothetical protein
LKRSIAEICLVCFWEDDGIFDLKVISNPNVMNLETGRKNFLKFGAYEKNSSSKFNKGRLE